MEAGFAGRHFSHLIKHFNHPGLFAFCKQLRKIQCSLRINRHHHCINDYYIYQFAGAAYRIWAQCEYPFAQSHGPWTRKTGTQQYKRWFNFSWPGVRSWIGKRQSAIGNRQSWKGKRQYALCFLVNPFFNLSTNLPATSGFWLPISDLRVQSSTSCFPPLSLPAPSLHIKINAHFLIKI